MDGFEDYLMGLECVGVSGIIVVDLLIIEICWCVVFKFEVYLSM